MKTFLKYNWSALLWAFFIVLMLFLPASAFDEVSSLASMDKLAHANIFFILVVLMMYGQSRQYGIKNINLKALLILCMGFCMLFGIFTELVQGIFIRSRTMDIMDALANGIGTVAGATACYFFLKIRKSTIK